MNLLVLFVSPHREDAAAISRMLDFVGIRCEHVMSCGEAGRRLERSAWDAVLTEASLDDGDWKDVLACALGLEYSPPVVVTHYAADDRLWAEALNLGCYDVLAQPFDTREVQRILQLACSQATGRSVASAAVALRSLSAVS
jgi:DNA-binding NtrC family response regulator